VRPEAEHPFVDNYGTGTIDLALSSVKLFPLNEILDNEEAPLVSSSVAEN
jgi:hypothetical protein